MSGKGFSEQTDDESNRPKQDTLYFDRNNTSTSGGMMGGSSIGKITSAPLLESKDGKKFKLEFAQLYQEACDSADSYTMRDERLEDRISGQRKLYRFKRYFTAVCMGFLPILITGFETFATEVEIKTCYLGGVEMIRKTCILANNNDSQYSINTVYNVLLYIFWVFAVGQYYLFFFCTLKKSKLIMSLFSFQIKVKATLFSALRRHWIGFTLQTLFLFLAVIFNRLVSSQMHSQQPDITSGGMTVRLALQGDQFTGTQYSTLIILTIAFALASYQLILNLALQPASSYFTSQTIFHSAFDSDVAYVLQQISKINKEISYEQFYSLLEEATNGAGTTLIMFPFQSQPVRHAILLVMVYKINKERLYLSTK